MTTAAHSEASTSRKATRDTNLAKTTAIEKRKGEVAPEQRNNAAAGASLVAAAQFRR
jgi:hypothetical protein